MDDQKSEILAKAQQTAQNSGYGMVQYHYCVVTNGEVGSVEDFSNAVFRILNSEHGWARRRDFRTFYGRQLRFQYRALPKRRPCRRSRRYVRSNTAAVWATM